MAHGSETRKQRGGKTGVKGRRSREGTTDWGPGLGFGRQDHMKNVKSLLNLWKNLGRTVKHEWFGTKPASATSLVNKGNTELRIEKVMSRLTPQKEDIAEKKEFPTQKGVVEPSKKNKAEEEAIIRRKAKDQSSPPNYPPANKYQSDKTSSWSAQIPLFSLPSEKADWIRRERESIERQRRD